MKIKYGIKEFLEEYKEALEQKPAVDSTARPNALEMLKSKAGLNKVRNERTEPR